MFERRKIPKERISLASGEFLQCLSPPQPKICSVLTSRLELAVKTTVAVVAAMIT